MDVAFPLGRFVAVTGVSGSGKSTLVSDILYRALARELNGSRARPGDHDAIEGLEAIDKVIDIDQSPIGRTPRSNPATYTGLFAPIRELFAGTPEARVRGYMPGRFSFNVKGGRCEHCKGDGILKIEMQFLPDVYVPCEVCKGKRYNREALEIHYKGRSIADVLEMTIEEALDFFSPVPSVRAKLQTLFDVGPGLRPPRPAGHHALRRRGPARQAGHGAVAARHGPDGLRPGRAHDRSAHGRRGEAAPRPAPARGRGQHRRSSSSTTWTWSRPRTGSWTWARRAASGAATSSPRALRRKWRAPPGSATGEYLARVLRGEPLVPLSAVTFAESVGHVTHATAGVETLPPPEKRATAAAAKEIGRA